MRFGLVFVGSPDATPAGFGESPYALVIEVARFADRNGFTFVSTPERHFARFGGLFPNPAVTSAALAAATAQVQIRPGSIVSPLHDTVRLVEDWSMVDQLSVGRVALSFDPGHNIDDFALAPDAYSNRNVLMYQQVNQVRALWRTRDVVRPNGAGARVELSVYPEPKSREVPIWVTVPPDPQAFVEAGGLGVNVLTELPGPDPRDLADRVRGYQEGRAEAGLDPTGGVVTVLQHTYVSDDPGGVRAARADLVAPDRVGPETPSVPARPAPIRSPVAERAAEYALVGSVDVCTRRVRRLEAAGADEIACVVDFVADPDLLRRGLPGLAALRAACAGEGRGEAAIGVGSDRFMGWG